jgi:hypothetical protein
MERAFATELGIVKCNKLAFHSPNNPEIFIANTGQIFQRLEIPRPYIEMDIRLDRCPTLTVLGACDRARNDIRANPTV